MKKLLLASMLVSSVAMGKPSMLSKAFNDPLTAVFGLIGGSGAIHSALMYSHLNNGGRIGFEDACVFGIGCVLTTISWRSLLDMERLNVDERRMVERLRDRVRSKDDEVLDSLEPDPHPKGLGGQLP